MGTERDIYRVREGLRKIADTLFRGVSGGFEALSELRRAKTAVHPYKRSLEAPGPVLDYITGTPIVQYKGVTRSSRYLKVISYAPNKTYTK